MKNIICSPNEIVRIKQSKGKPIHFVRPLRKQPPEGYEFDGFVDDNLMLFTCTKGDWSEEPTIGFLIPFAPGMSLCVKETWRIWLATKIAAHVAQNHKDVWEIWIQYKDMSRRKFMWPKMKLFPSCLDGNWMSPATMPKDFSRYTLTVDGEPKVKRVQGLSPDEMVALEIDENWCDRSEVPRCDDIIYDFIQHWNARFKKHPWDSNPYVVLFSGGFERGE